MKLNQNKTKVKNYFEAPILKKEHYKDLLYKKMKVHIDRPKGTRHKGFVYPFNYGFIKGIFAEDGLEVDVYVVDDDGEELDIEVFIIGIVYRFDDDENKLIGVKNIKNAIKDKTELARIVSFREQTYKTEIII